MAYRVLEVTLKSARELKNVNMLTRMEVYAVATISGDPITRQCTSPDPYGGRNPSWNVALRFTVPPTAANATGCLHVLLRTERAFGDRDVGEVVVPLSELLAGTSACDPGPRPPQSASYHVRKLHRAETRGVLHLSYRLGPVVAPQVPQPQPQPKTQPVVAYAVGRPFHPQPAYAYVPALELPPCPRAPGDVATQTASPQAYYVYAAMPPTPPQASSGGHVAPMPQTPPKAYGQHYSTPPPMPQQAYGDRVAMSPPPPKAYGQFSMPPATPPKTAGHVPSSSWKAKNNGDIEYGYHSDGMMAGGGMMMSDAAAYNAGYRAGLTADWGKAVY